MIPKLSPKLSGEELSKVLNSRYAVKRFDPERTISASTWAAIEESLILTPSSYGLQPWRFIVITNPELKAKLRPASWNQSQITDASHLVVLTTLKKVSPEWVDLYVQRVSDVREIEASKLEGLKKAIVNDAITGARSRWVEQWLAHQAYIALGQLCLSAALLGVDACPMEGIELERYDSILGLEETQFATRVLCALGYRSEQDPCSQMKKVRFERSLMIDSRD
jgi:nitroreductase